MGVRMKKMEMMELLLSMMMIRSVVGVDGGGAYGSIRKSLLVVVVAAWSAKKQN